MTKRKVGGYIYRQELARAIMANRAARRALAQIIDEVPGGIGQARLLLLLALVGNHLSNNLDALMQLQEIIQRGRNDG